MEELNHVTARLPTRRCHVVASQHFVHPRNDMESMHYALTTVEGLHLTCDFVVYSAALFGCPPDYSPTRVGLHDSFREPYEIYGAIPFREYGRFAETSFMDEETLKALGSVTAQRMKDFTCIAWELDLSTIECFGISGTGWTGYETPKRQRLSDWGLRSLDCTPLLRHGN